MLDPLYIRARRALLDALEALGRQRESVVLVGAQAVYLHTGEGALNVAPFTHDADILVEPQRLRARPLLEPALIDAGFAPGEQPGRWIRDGVPVDLMVPEALAGPGRRAARLGAHGKRAARRVRGLEGALRDVSIMELGSLEQRDVRRFRVRVAGPGALLVSKLIKLGERIGGRERDKDALDLFRLLQAIEIAPLRDRIVTLLSDPTSGPATREAMTLLERHFATADGTGNDMLVRATAGLEPERTMRASCAALAADLLLALRARSESRAIAQSREEPTDQAFIDEISDRDDGG